MSERILRGIIHYKFILDSQIIESNLDSEQLEWIHDIVWQKYIG